ncbi:MAG: hypothetical protein GY841_17710 [FCB group bacterium]|nr:hypothetical protein [FCB group bacterium]
MTLKINSNDIINRYLPSESVDFYLGETRKANAKFNLFSSSMADDDLRLLIAESLIPLEKNWFDPVKPILDIGSGWGIPAVPLLLSGNGFDMTMLERAEKKAGFLSLLLHQMIALDSQAKYNVVNLSLESYRPADKYGCIVMRQVSLDDRLWRHIKRISLPDAQLIYFGSSPGASIKSSIETLSYMIDDFAERKIVKIVIL